MAHKWIALFNFFLTFCFYLSLCLIFVLLDILTIASFLFFHILLSIFYKKKLIKAIFFSLEKKTPWSMSAISELYNRGYNILELFDNLPNFSFAKTETDRDY